VRGEIDRADAAAAELADGPATSDDVARLNFSDHRGHHLDLAEDVPVTNNHLRSRLYQATSDIQSAGDLDASGGKKTVQRPRGAASILPGMGGAEGDAQPRRSARHGGITDGRHEESPVPAGAGQAERFRRFAADQRLDGAGRGALDFST
jgi:hypothetical protein